MGHYGRDVGARVAAFRVGLHSGELDRGGGDGVIAGRGVLEVESVGSVGGCGG